MAKISRIWLWLALPLLLAVLVLTTRGPGPVSPNPAGTFSFAALGDAPYYPWENLQYKVVLSALDAHDLAWVIHVGDIFWRRCLQVPGSPLVGWVRVVVDPGGAGPFTFESHVVPRWKYW